jgi:hypothetical protein
MDILKFVPYYFSSLTFRWVNAREVPISIHPFNSRMSFPIFSDDIAFPL